MYLLAAIGMHGLYDFIVFSTRGNENSVVHVLIWLNVPLVVGMIFVSRKLIRRHVTADAIMMGKSLNDTSLNKNQVASASD